VTAAAPCTQSDCQYGACHEYTHVDFPLHSLLLSFHVYRRPRQPAHSMRRPLPTTLLALRRRGADTCGRDPIRSRPMTAVVTSGSLTSPSRGRLRPMKPMQASTTTVNRSWIDPEQVRGPSRLSRNRKKSCIRRDALGLTRPRAGGAPADWHRQDDYSLDAPNHRAVLMMTPAQNCGS
jgi:hypothetical protein